MFTTLHACVFLAPSFETLGDNRTNSSVHAISVLPSFDQTKSKHGPLHILLIIHCRISGGFTTLSTQTATLHLWRTTQSLKNWQVRDVNFDRNQLHQDVVQVLEATIIDFPPILSISKFQYTILPWYKFWISMDLSKSYFLESGHIIHEHYTIFSVKSSILFLQI